MKILALEKEYPGKTAQEFREYAEAEARKAWDLYQSDSIREIYFRGDQNSAVIMLECEDLQEAEAVLAELPFVKNKLIRFELIPLVPYPGFERLFK